MKRFPKLFACGIWIASTLILFTLGLTIIGVLAVFTGSGLLGICGPTASGPYADLLGFTFIGVLITSPVFGGYIAWRFYLRLTRERTEHESAISSEGTTPER